MWRLLSFLLVALALSFTPMAMAGDAAMAHGATMAMSDMAGNCTDSGQPGDSVHTSKAKPHCTTICAAVAPLPATMAAQVTPPKAALAMTLSPMLSGIAPERDTPPPRASPEP